MKVLLGWELGAGQGHIQRLVALSERLAAQGWEPIFALKSFNLKGNVNFPWQQIPAPRLPFSGRENSYTFADLLAAFGFAQVDLLRHHLQNWQDILKTIQPDLVITDHAPGLVLAAWGLVPTVVVGSYFAVPPPVEVFPAFRSAMPPESVQQQQQVSETVRQVIPLETSLGQALNGDRSFIFSVPELDFYRAYRSILPTTEYVGIHLTPLAKNVASTESPPWTYLMQEYPAYELVLRAFKTEPQFQPFQPLKEALVDKSIAIHHGGLTTTIGCLLAGIPQLVLPCHIEQQLNGAALKRLGAAEMLVSPTEANLDQVRTHLLSCIDQAQALATGFARWNQDFLDRVVETCVHLCQ